MDSKEEFGNMFDRAPKLQHKILADFEMDEEFEKILNKHKDHDISAIEMDLKIQGDRIIYVLNRMMAKLNMMAYIPLFLKDNAALLRKFLPKPDFSLIILAFNRYTEEKIEHTEDYELSDGAERIESITVIAERDNVRLSGHNLLGGPKNVSLHDVKLDSVVNQVIDILFYNKCLRHFIKQNQKHANVKLVNDFIKPLSTFKEIIKEIVYITGDEQDVLDKKLRRMYKTNILLKEAIEDLRNKLNSQSKELGDQLNEKLDIIKMYQEKMQTMKEDNEINMEKYQHDSEKQMMQKSLLSEALQAELSAEADSLTRQYNQLIENDLSDEKVFRAKRSKLEAQLQNWIGTYDQDIGEKNDEYEVLKREYDKKYERKKQLEDEMADQEEEYLRLMTEKQDEEERIRRLKLYQIVTNHAARVIQTAWRAYRERKLAKKRAKKAKAKAKAKKK